MGKVLVSDSSLTAIGNALRTRYGNQTTYKPAAMGPAVEAVPNSYAAGDEGKVVDNGALVAQESLSVTVNGTYDTTKKNSVTVNVQGGSVSSGGSEQWDLTESLTGKNQSWVLSSSGVTQDGSGVHFNSANAYLSLDFWKPGFTIEIDFGAISLASGGNHKRTVMAGGGEKGLIYRSTGVWAFYNGSWQDSNENDGSFFDNSTLKIVIDANGYWHIYKDDVLFFEPTVGGGLRGTPILIGASSNSMNNATVTGLRVY